MSLTINSYFVTQTKLYTLLNKQKANLFFFFLKDSSQSEIILMVSEFVFADLKSVCARQKTQI